LVSLPLLLGPPCSPLLLLPLISGPALANNPDQLGHLFPVLRIARVGGAGKAPIIEHNEVLAPLVAPLSGAGGALGLDAITPPLDLLQTGNVDPRFCRAHG